MSFCELFQSFNVSKVYAYLLLVVGDLLALYLHQRFKLFPTVASVFRPVNCTVTRLNKNILVVLTTPHHVLDVAIKFKCLILDSVCEKTGVLSVLRHR
jgi:hypothetical protein